MTKQPYHQQIRVSIGDKVRNTRTSNWHEKAGLYHFNLEVKLGKLWANYGDSSITAQQKHEYEQGNTVMALNY